MKYLNDILVLTKATKKRRNYYTGHCPVHNDKKQSFSIAFDSEDDLNPLVKCHAGCSQKDIIDFLKNSSIWDKREPMINVAIAPIIQKGIGVEKLSPWANYLSKRGIFYTEGVEFFGCMDYHEETSKEELCVVFPTTNKIGDYVGCQRIYIDDLGYKLKVNNPKKYLGELKGASCKFGSNVVEELHLAEGIETALSVYGQVKQPTWAMVSCTNFNIDIIPKSVECLHIWADKDRSGAGQKAADDLAMAIFTEYRIPVFVHFPDEIGTDWNDQENAMTISERYAKDPIYYFKSTRECMDGEIVTDADIPETVEKLDRYFVECAAYSDMPKAFIAMPMFTAMSTLISNKAKIVSPFDGFKYTPSFWSCIIAPPSARKTTALSKGLSGLKYLVEYKENLCQDYLKSKSDEIRMLKKEIRASKKMSEKNDFSEASERKLMGLEERLKSILDLAKNHEYIVNNTTIERLLKDMSNSPGAYLLESGELASWLAMLNKDYQSHARGIFLDLYSGVTNYIQKRMNADSNIKVKHASCNVTGTSQPQSIFPYLKDMGADGLFQRFQGIAIQLNSTISEVKTVERNMQNQSYINEMFLWLDAHITGDLSLDKNAQIVAHDYETYKRRMVYELEQINSVNMASHVGKTDTSFMTLAAVFHCIDCYENKIWSNLIRVDSCEVAVRVTKYLVDRIRLSYLASSSKSDLMSELMSDIDSGRHGEVLNKTELYYRCYRRRSEHNFDLAMEELVRRQYLIKKQGMKGDEYYRPVTKINEVQM